jgi:hypothetical protein
MGGADRFFTYRTGESSVVTGRHNGRSCTRVTKSEHNGPILHRLSFLMYHLNLLNRMNNSIRSLRPTLKLKAGARKPAPATKPPSVPPPDKKAKLKPGAHWSDEYKARMQADMGASRGR